MPIEFMEDGKVMVYAGVGDILMTKLKSEEMSYENEIGLYPDDRSNPINSKISQERWDAEFAGKTTDDIDFPVRMSFANVECLDALIITLMEIRIGMVDGIAQEKDEGSYSSKEPKATPIAEINEFMEFARNQAIKDG